MMFLFDALGDFIANHNFGNVLDGPILPLVTGFQLDVLAGHREIRWNVCDCTRHTSIGVVADQSYLTIGHVFTSVGFVRHTHPTWMCVKADDRGRFCNLNHTKIVLYQLSYVSIGICYMYVGIICSSYELPSFLYARTPNALSAYTQSIIGAYACTKKLIPSLG